MLIAMMAIVGTAVYGQEKTVSFKVYGNCEMCKKRIEKAADIKGVSTATWDVDSKMMAVVFNPDKTSQEEIQKGIAQAGHDTQDFAAPDSSYDQLPGCCQYDRKNVSDAAHSAH